MKNNLILFILILVSCNKSDTTKLENENFRLNYPNQWTYELMEGDVHTLLDTNNGIGAFQITSYTKIKNSNTKENLNTGKVIKYKNFDAIYSLDTISSDQFSTSKWEIKKGGQLLYCTYTFSKEGYGSAEYNNEVKRLNEIINSIVIK